MAKEKTTPKTVKLPDGLIEIIEKKANKPKSNTTAHALMVNAIKKEFSYGT
jgi:hypothetical protein